VLFLFNASKKAAEKITGNNKLTNIVLLKGSNLITNGILKISIKKAEIKSTNAMEIKNVNKLCEEIIVLLKTKSMNTQRQK